MEGDERRGEERNTQPLNLEFFNHQFQSEIYDLKSEIPLAMV